VAHSKKIVIIGGCGHVGLPLGVKFALNGSPTVLVDINSEAVDTVNSGVFPFLELGGDAQLQTALRTGLRASTDKDECRDADVVVFVIGTPVDEHLNPKLSDVFKIFDSYVPVIRPGALVVMRSTLFPGTMEHLHSRLTAEKKDLLLAFCPERVSQGYALDEIDSLPQIISSFDEASFEAAYALFSTIAPEIIRLTPLEAEMTKLMANSWRYLEFAIANQFYMIAEANGVDFYKIYNAIRYDYPRAKGYKSPGFAAGPCLFKDTMQLASFFDNHFTMGHSAMLVNEGLANFVVDKVAREFDGSLWGKTVGLLGMAFKGDNDDIRESLSFKVKKGLEFKGATVICTDPFVAGLESLDTVQAQSDILVLCTPHTQYRTLKLSKKCVDIWGIYEQATLEILPGKPQSLKVAKAG
jgi:UDP-N-acetyl-D-mannosaminuronic acid dehydrogenase